MNTLIGGKWISAVALLACVACEPTSAKLERNASYFRDSNTNLCFVYWITYTQSGGREVVSNVPCTPEVLGMIQRGNR